MKTKLMIGAISTLLFAACQKEAVSTKTTVPSGADFTNSSSLDFTTSAASYVFTGTDNWAQYVSGGYGVINDAWGTGTNNTERLNVWSSTSWNVQTTQPQGGSAVKTYPHSWKDVNKNIGSINNLTSNFDYSVPGSGWAGDMSYDIWLTNKKYEVMIWMGRQNGFNPICDNYDAHGAVPSYTNVNVGGHTFNVYHKFNSSSGKYVFSFLRTSNTSKGSVNIKDVLNWIRNTPRWYGNEYLADVEFGFEIGWGSGQWNLNSFSVTSN